MPSVGPDTPAKKKHREYVRARRVVLRKLEKERYAEPFFEHAPQLMPAPSSLLLWLHEDEMVARNGRVGPRGHGPSF